MTTGVDERRALDAALTGPIAQCLADRPVVVFGGGATNPGVLRRIARCTKGTVHGVPDVPIEVFDRLAHEVNRPDSRTDGDALAQRLALVDPPGAACLYLGSAPSVTAVAGRPVVGARQRSWELAEHKDAQLAATRSTPGAPRRMLGVRSVDRARELLLKLRARGPHVIQGVVPGAPAMASRHTLAVTAQLDDDAVMDAAARLAAMRRVIVSPLVPGRPVTYYGFSDGVRTLYLPPVEGVVLYCPATGEMRAPGALTGTIRPPEQVACAAGLRVASRFIRRLGYVGAFGLDGVLTSDGLAVQDVNTRLCAGHRLYSEALELPMMIVDLALRTAGAAASAILDLVRSAVTTRGEVAPLALWEEAAAERELRASCHGWDADRRRDAVVRRLAWAADVRLLTTAVGTAVSEAP